MNKFILTVFQFSVLLLSIYSYSLMSQTGKSWQVLDIQSLPQQRHEATFIEFEGKFYALGGRGLKPVSIYDPKRNQWTEGAMPPLALHHFQAVIYQDKIVIAAAMTGSYPTEQGVSNLYYYFPKQDKWQIGPTIPPNRVRGGAGAVVIQDTLYLLAGIKNGHTDGWVKWVDTFDFKTQQWRILPDAPRVRDHFQASVVENNIYLVGGRKTSFITQQVFSLLVKEIDVFDTINQSWLTLAPEFNLPTPRAGNSTLAVNGEIIVAGGETNRAEPAHNEVEVFNPTNSNWRSLPKLQAGRHGTGIIYYDNALWTCCGSGARGGKPELTSIEKLVF